MHAMYNHQNHQGYEVIKHPICRFFVQGICGGAKSDFHVDLVLSVDGLLTLIKSVYGLLNKHQKTPDTYRSFNWRLHFHGAVFTIEDPDIHHFHLLQHPIRNGQTGWFEGSNINFRFSVVSVYAGEICPSKLSYYPKIYVLKTQSSFTSEMKEDWLSDELKGNAKDFHRRFREYMSGANVWNQDASGDYFRDRPKPPKWTSQEDEILSLLVHSGYKFQESWQCFLQYSFLNRSEVGTAQQWYKVRKRQLSDISSDSDQSKGDMIIQAKQLCMDLMEQHLKVGVPELGDHPLKRKNLVLSETHEYNIVPATKRLRSEYCPPDEVEIEHGR
jgi:hypothetical protein